MAEVKVLLVTVPDGDVAKALCDSLLEERLIACANVVSGVTSLYRWEGAVHEDPELLLVLKSSTDRVEALVRRIPELHPYDVPEVLVVDVSAGHRPYLDWVGEECRAQGGPER